MGPTNIRMEPCFLVGRVAPHGSLLLRGVPIVLVGNARDGDNLPLSGPVRFSRRILRVLCGRNLMRRSQARGSSSAEMRRR